jgi:murein DD-endopeptidase MepM/ murein hydrolase activator NlpD
MPGRLTHISLILILAASLFISCKEKGATEPKIEDENTEFVNEGIQWPLSRKYTPNADEIRAQYGPRNIGRYDFHAGIDMAAPIGTPVYPIMVGQVTQVNPWDGTSTGAGNAITIRHADNQLSSYLHLDEILVTVGQIVNLSTIVGRVGETGATYPHLHLGYFIRDSNIRNEQFSKNPLEILPHTTPFNVTATFSGNNEVILGMPLQSMTANTIELYGPNEGDKLTADYYEIVARGITPRREQIQFGVHFDVARAVGIAFNLTLKPANDDFEPVRVVVKDFKGDVLLDASK